ncbi:microaggregate-binding protein 1 [Nocardia nova]|uniref:CsbD family protein n=1 Tax=Nocardia nova SH22a TaxID=1415166 RepID=W5TQ37_9NOCA|nr:CsbD family protein [Nocardia nova]AHH21274.1 hypothetical protein NONO_c65040 [Nocardia nova SH22a]
MSDHARSGAEEGVESVVEGIKGRVKEAAGALAGNKDLREEGSAQQDKAEAQKEAAKNEARAEKDRAEADLHEQRQKSHQDE